MSGIETRDMVRFFGAIALLLITHAVLFKIDAHDVTQMLVMAGCYTVLRAIRERPNA